MQKRNKWIVVVTICLLLMVGCSPAQTPQAPATPVPQTSTETSEPRATLSPSETSGPTDTPTLESTPTSTPEILLPAESVVGTWGDAEGTNDAGFLIFREDFTWGYAKIAFNESFKPEIFNDPRHFGTWEADGDLLVIYNDEGSFSCGGTTGIYNLIQRDGDVVVFISVDETCSSRRIILQTRWKMIE